MQKITVKLEFSSICYDDQVEQVTATLLEDLRNAAMGRFGSGVNISLEDSEEDADDVNQESKEYEEGEEN